MADQNERIYRQVWLFQNFKIEERTAEEETLCDTKFYIAGGSTFQMGVSCFDTREQAVAFAQRTLRAQIAMLQGHLDRLQ